MVDKPTFEMGDHVEKISGSSWRGRVVGTYSTDLTREGYAVESDTEKGSVQIYPVKALRLVTPANGEQVERVEDVALNMQKRIGEMPIEALVAYNQACRDLAERLATLSTPTEDARSRVQVLEEAAQAVEGLQRKVPYEYNRHPCSTTMKRAAAVIRALGNKETDRHG